MNYPNIKTANLPRPKKFLSDCFLLGVVIFSLLLLGAVIIGELMFAHKP